jgi:SAM-dependent methyltransferase
MQGRIGFLGIASDLSDKSFDCVLMIEVIEHILDEQLDDALSGVARAVRPGGTLIVTTPNNEDLDLGMAYCPVSNMLFHRWQHVRSFTDVALRELLLRYGFEEIVTHKLEFNDAIYSPYDPLGGRSAIGGKAPSFFAALRANAPARVGAETNLLYVGKKLG